MSAEGSCYRASHMRRRDRGARGKLSTLNAQRTTFKLRMRDQHSTEEACAIKEKCGCRMLRNEE